jgi:hypothetical protein
VGPVWQILVEHLQVMDGRRDDCVWFQQASVCQQGDFDIRVACTFADANTVIVDRDATADDEVDWRKTVQRCGGRDFCRAVPVGQLPWRLIDLRGIEPVERLQPNVAARRALVRVGVFGISEAASRRTAVEPPAAAARAALATAGRATGTPT